MNGMTLCLALSLLLFHLPSAISICHLVEGFIIIIVPEIRHMLEPFRRGGRALCFSVPAPLGIAPRSRSAVDDRPGMMNRWRRPIACLEALF
ncbi:hypothetical protein V8C26DRAFT_393635 [Trichoderma gracile]